MAPCIVSMATVVMPTSSANGVSNSKRLTSISPAASSGTPLRMAPKATPNSSASNSELRKKLASQTVRHVEPGRCERNSSVTARKMSTTSTSMKAM